jgi:hypothetical protein
LMPNGPTTFESIIMPNDLDEEAKIAWEVWRLNSSWIKKHVSFIASCLSSPLTFFCGEWWQQTKSYFVSNYALCDLPFCLPKGGKVWFFTTNNMGLFLWRSIYWVNIQLLGVNGKMLMWLLIHRTYTMKNPPLFFCH